MRSDTTTIRRSCSQSNTVETGILMPVTASPSPTTATADGSWAVPLGRVAAPLRDQVLNTIRQAILDFQLQPGARLIERELIEQLGVSRTTIREVIALLVSEGLVTVIPQRGAIVSIISVEDASDIYEMRGALEAQAVRRFVDRATPEQVARLRKAWADIDRASRSSSDRARSLQMKDAFYEVLLDGANSPMLTQVLTMLQGRVRLMRSTSLSVPGRPKQASAELRRVVELIEAGDADGAAEAAAVHVRTAAEVGMRQLAGLELGQGLAKQHGQEKPAKTRSRKRLPADADS
jgi:DNA-binding GntR family transcriptional regulator